jgi:hypothetical protein
MRSALVRAAFGLTVAAGLCLAQAVNLSGNWHLNVDKSKWGKMNKPHSVVLTIEHNEPNIHYHGVVVYANEDERTFGFSGAFDRKPYPMSRSFGDGEITLTRVDTHSFDSVFKSADGVTTESSRTSISRDGRMLTRMLKLTGADGTKQWTEVYEKR